MSRVNGTNRFSGAQVLRCSGSGARVLGFVGCQVLGGVHRSSAGSSIPNVDPWRTLNRKNSIAEDPENRNLRTPNVRTLT